jgi:4,5-dihydroxyphthalate decarboxylase
VSQYDVDWYMERTEELSHGGATGFTPPEGIKFHQIPPDKSLATMLVNHELDAAPVSRAFGPANVIDRSTNLRAEGADWSKVKPLFPDEMGEFKRFVNTHGFVPANHCYVIREDVYEQYPWLAFNLYAAFIKAKDYWYERMPRQIPSDLFFGRYYLDETRKLLGKDPFPYGVKANDPMMQMAIGFSHEQGLTDHRMTYEELFAPSVLEL